MGCTEGFTMARLAFDRGIADRIQTIRGVGRP